MTATEHVILVDEHDNPKGIAEKLAAHQQSLCHRAFSIFIFREHPQVEILLQQRAHNKYHSPGQWTNTCCSHPRPGEDIILAGQRRLKEEMNIETELTSAGFFHYIAHFDNGLTENEIDHVLIGKNPTSEITINPEEAQAYQWINISQLKNELELTPHKFTPWLKQALQLAETKWNQDKRSNLHNAERFK